MSEASKAINAVENIFPDAIPVNAQALHAAQATTTKQVNDSIAAIRKQGKIPQELLTHVDDMMRAAGVVTEEVFSRLPDKQRSIGHIMRKVNGRFAFAVPILEADFQIWRGNRLKERNAYMLGPPRKKMSEYLGTLNPKPARDEWLGHGTYAKEKCKPENQGGDPAIAGMLKIILGNNFTFATDAKYLYVSRTPWSLNNKMMRIGPKAVKEPAKELTAVARSQQAINDGVDEALNLARVHLTDVPDPNTIEGAAEIIEIKKRITKIFQCYGKYDDLENITQSAMQKLIGSEKGSPQDVIDQLLVGYFAIRAENKRLGLTDENLTNFFNMNGVEGYFEKMLRQVDHEHAYLFEQTAALILVSKHNPKDIIIQSKIGSKSGPDAVLLKLRRVQRADGTMADEYYGIFLQMKSYENVSDVLSAASHGEALSQAKSDIRRILRESRLQIPQGQNIAEMPFDPVFHCKINYRRVADYPRDVDTAEVLAKLTAGQKDKVKKASGLFDENLDADTAEAVRKAVLEVHIKAKATEVNSQLADYRGEWIDSFFKNDDGSVLNNEQVKKKLLDEFGPISSNDDRKKIKEALAIINRNPTPSLDNIASDLKTALGGIFDKTFDKPVRVEFELVDAKMGTDFQ